MKNLSIKTLRKDLTRIWHHVIKHHAKFTVSVENGNVIILNEQDYQNLTETIYLSSHSQTRREILAGLLQKEIDCIPAKNISW